VRLQDLTGGAPVPTCTSAPCGWTAMRSSGPWNRAGCRPANQGTTMVALVSWFRFGSYW
jgi:hypothetical protein